MKSTKKDAKSIVSSETERSPRSVPPVYAPSLVFFGGRRRRDQLFCMLSDGSNHSRSVPELRRMYWLISSYGWLLLRSYYTNECRLFNPSTLSKINLPDLGDGAHNIGVLTSSPSDPDCTIMLFSENRKSCIFCRVGDTKWIEQNIASRKNSNIVIEDYTAALSANGKIYLFFRGGIAVIDIKDNFFSIRPYGRERPELSIPQTVHSQNYYVESCGEIYRIIMICLEVSRVVQKFDVFKLNLSTMIWEKVTSIGDNIFLLGGNPTAASVSATELGIKGNRIVFFLDYFSTLNSFDMEDETIAALDSCFTEISKCNEPFWSVPNCTPVKKEVAQSKKIEKEVKSEKIICSDVLPELLEMILQSLSLSDYLRFRLACKSLISIKLPVRSILPQTDSGSQNQLQPWFLFFPGNKKGVCSFTHPIYTDSYTVNVPQLEGAIVRHAKFGWFLMSKEDSIFFFNPCTMEIVTLPDPDDSRYLFESITFTSPPTSADCVVCGKNGWDGRCVTISMYRKGEDSWHTHEFDVSKDLVLSACNPVFVNGVFYYLAKDGKLGVFNPNETEESDMWRIISKVFVPEAHSLSYSDLYENSPRTFLMECDNEIFSAFVDLAGCQVRVYKLDQSKELMEWIVVESLGDMVMFLSHTTSILRPAGLKGTENRIYFPRFKANESLFYSLSSGKYHSFGKTDSYKDWTDSWGHWNCTWFQPSD